MGSKEQTAQAVENCAKIQMANVQTDRPTPVDNEIQLEIPPVEVRFLTKQTNKVKFGIRLKKTGLHLTNCLVETRVGPK